MLNRACLVALTLGCLPLLSQTLGEITGTVTDASGALVAGCRVAITNVNSRAG